MKNFQDELFCQFVSFFGRKSFSIILFSINIFEFLKFIFLNISLKKKIDFIDNTLSLKTKKMSKSQRELLNVASYS